jgi:hypothetical protein
MAEFPSPELAEAIAARRALSVAKVQGFQKVIRLSFSGSACFITCS